jgi:excisionase family DNA binding protein
MPIEIKSEIYYTAKELAERFDVTLETIRDWRKNKGLNCYKVSERKYYYNESEIELFLKGNKNKI